MIQYSSHGPRGEGGKMFAFYRCVEGNYPCGIFPASLENLKARYVVEISPSKVVIFKVSLHQVFLDFHYDLFSNIFI